jgi:enterochelin esterase-like enzyme
MTSEPGLTSELGLTVRQALAAGGPQAVLALARSGRGPVAEPAADGAGYDVTFVFTSRRAAPARVGLFCPALPAGFALLGALGGGVFAGTFRLPAGARVKYHFCLDPADDLDPAALALLARSPTARHLDYLNPQLDQVQLRGLRMRMIDSLLTLPGARPAPAVRPRPGVPAGRIEKLTIQSRALGRSKDCLVYRPASAAGLTGPLPVVLLLQGGEEWQERAFLDNLSAEGPARPFTAVLFGERSFTAKLRDLTSGTAHTRFVVDELWPALGQRMPLPPDATVAGFSAGGLAAAWLAADEPSLFPRAALISAALHLTRPGRTQQASGPPAALAHLSRPRTGAARVYLAAGWYEDAWEPAIYANTVALAGLLERQGTAVRLDREPTSHDSVSARAYLSAGLAWLSENG